MVLSLQLVLAALALVDRTDAELVELFLGTRGERYFAELYRRYGAKVYARCATMLGDDHEAHDAAQEIFERVLGRLGGWRGEAAFGTWLYAITSRHCIDRLRRRKTHPVDLTVDEHLEFRGGIHDPDDSTEDWIAQQGPTAIRHILRHVSEADRAVLVLVYMEDMPVRQLAEVLDLKESATKMRLLRARERARGIYEAWAATQPELA